MARADGRSAVSTSLIQGLKSCGIECRHMIPSNYFREDFYTYTAEADKNIYVVMQVRNAS